jgi:hypothetical protein
VGIEHYAGGKGWQLPGPVNDALAIRQWLLDKGVPNEQIHLHLSPLPENQGKLADLHQGSLREAVDQDIRQTLSSLKGLPHSKAELLIVYWAGHGLKSGDRHCLLLANAKQDDFVSYSMENLRLTLSCVECAGFSQQIFLIDTCQTFHGKYYTPPTIQELPVGERTRKNQFQFFACQDGQAAKDSGEDHFTSVLLRKLQESPDLDAVWPPDMKRWADLVQADFKTEAGLSRSSSQYPVTCEVVDWDGNASSERFAVFSSTSAAAELSLLDAIRALARLLAVHLGQPRQREKLIRNFGLCGKEGQDIKVTVQRQDGASEDFEELITTCIDHGSLNLCQDIVLREVGNRVVKDKIKSAFLDLEAILPIKDSL